MVNTSHSRSVRGTLSHPSSSPSSQPPPSLSDATSLAPENASIPLPPHDSAPPPCSSSSSPADSAPPTPSTLGTAPVQDVRASAKGTGQREATGRGKGEEEAHSRQVRGTLGNTKREARVDKTLLGDPTSLARETDEGAPTKVHEGKASKL